MNPLVIKIIFDNCTKNETLQEGWGFSCLVDLGSRKILFDTGVEPATFFANFQKLSLNWHEITDLVYSHKHFDHVGGFDEVILKLKATSRLFLPKKFPAKKIPPAIHTEIVQDLKEIDHGVYTLALKGGFRLYEQALLIETQKGLVVITGCAHPGIVRLLEEVKKRFKQPIHLVLGGFHLFKSKAHQIDDVVNQFKALKVQIAAPCHCTGKIAIARLQQAFGEAFYEVGAGTTLTISR